jgi:uncharacterized GH25 family protein
MKHRYWLTGVGLVLSVWATAHEFWLQPTRFFVQPGQTVQVRTLVGENFTGEPSEGRKNRILLYKHYQPGGETDLPPTLTNDHYGEVAVTLTHPGTHVLLFANTPKFIRLDADKFLAYLNEDGLDNVIAARAEAGDTLKPGYELYSRCAKTLLQVGDNVPETLPKTPPLTLDIVPTENPYTLRAGQKLKFQIRFNDKPQPDALVRYWVKARTGNVTYELARSDNRGFVQFKLRPGQNMVSTVRMVPAEAQPNVPDPADWRSYWSSVTFGCK